MNMDFQPPADTCIYQILAKLNQAGGNTICSQVYKVINFIWNKEELPQQWKESIIVPILRKLIKL
jgi:hypothetical protein